MRRVVLAVVVVQVALPAAMLSARCDTAAVDLRLVVLGGAAVAAYAACVGVLSLRRPVAASVSA